MWSFTESWWRQSPGGSGRWCILHNHVSPFCSRTSVCYCFSQDIFGGKIIPVKSSHLAFDNLPADVGPSKELLKVAKAVLEEEVSGMFLRGTSLPWRLCGRWWAAEALHDYGSRPSLYFRSQLSTLVSLVTPSSPFLFIHFPKAHSRCQWVVKGCHNFPGQKQAGSVWGLGGAVHPSNLETEPGRS